MSTPTISQLAATLRAFGITSVRQMEEITTELLCRMPTSGAINGELSGDGDPTGAYFPVFVGQLYHDTTADTYYRSTGLDVYDWVAIGGGASYQDMQVAWTPTNVKLGEVVGFGSQAYYSYDNLIQTLVFSQATMSFMEVHYFLSLVSISASNLVDLDSIEDDSGRIWISDCPLLTSISFPVLVNAPYFFKVTFCDTISSISLPSLTFTRVLNLSHNSILSSVSVPSLVFPNAPFSTDEVCMANNSSLSQASVNHLLARCVASPALSQGKIDLSGGTNASPSGQGIADKATLIGRGLTVTTN